MLSARENGSPLSLANDHVMRDAAAKHPIALQNSSTIIIPVMIDAPAVDPVAYSNMRMNSGVVDVVSSINCMISGALKRSAISILRARQPLIPRLSNIDLATSVLAFLTSSDIYSS